MNDEVRKRLLDVLSACEEIDRYTVGLDFTAYEEDGRTKRAVERLLEIVGEALNIARRVDPTLADALSDVPRIVAVRHRVIHGYDSVDHEIVWDIVQSQIPVLSARVSALLDEAGDVTGSGIGYPVRPHRDPGVPAVAPPKHGRTTMDETRSSAPGHVEPSPEAEPLDPAASPGPAAAHPPAVVPPEPASAQAQASAGPSGSDGGSGSAPQDRAGEIGRDLGQRLKPVAVAAEGIAAQALDLSAKGLSRLAAMLEERRRRRDAGQ